MNTINLLATSTQARHSVDINEMISQIWPLIAAVRYMWFILLGVFLVMLGLSIFKAVEYARKKDDADYKQSKKSLTKAIVINLVVIPIIVSVLLGIASGIISSKFINTIVNNWKTTADHAGYLTADGGWLDSSVYTAPQSTSGVPVLGIWINPPITVKDGDITNFDFIKNLLSPYIHS